MLSGCISAFEAPEDMKDMSGVLVVEGVILEEGTKITLSRTVALSEEFSDFYLFDNVNNAIIHVIDEGNNIVAVAAQEYNWGSYIVNENFSFVPGMKYALDIRIGDKHYQSAFSAPESTPEIDSVSWKLNDDKSIEIMVSTHTPNNETLYCLWSFEENWEIRSHYFAPLKYDPILQILIPQSLTGDNIFYCWAKGYSQSLLLASTEKYREAVIKDHKIHQLQPGNSRYSYLYSILVRQYQVNREASLYFENLQRNIDESGSLFAPQPSEMTGNIRCLSDPNEYVIGYVFASKQATSRLLIPMAELSLNNFDDTNLFLCSDIKSFISPMDAYYQGYRIISENGDYAFLTCVDCTSRGGTKTKPDFWPNDHQ
jgi:hypothetical protein